MKRFLLAIALSLAASACSAQVHNLKVVTDASADYTDLRSLVHSVTDKWQTPEQKCWAMFYWNHIARRQTTPMILHGMELTDPIRQFNDYGYTQCSTISGINCGIWNAMGFPVHFWDIANHTVAEVQYDGRWHMYDNSMTALYTLCDGKTLAGVEDIGRAGSCAASGGKVELGHIAKYHCLYGTSPNGFLTGADTQRSLDEESRCFNPNALKLRTYYNNWDWGHRYILNLRPGESYTRYYHSLGDGPGFYVPNEGKDPEAANPRYHIRGNGRWTFKPDLSPAAWRRAVYSARNIAATPQGLSVERPASAGQVVFSVQGANVITGQEIKATFAGQGRASIAISTDNGTRWRTMRPDAEAPPSASVKLIDEVNGAYEVLIRVQLTGGARLTSVEVETVTMLNSKTQPQLRLGRNTVYVAAGEQTGSIVLWPEMQGGKYRDGLLTEENIACEERHPGYLGAVYPEVAGKPSSLVYRLDAPGDLAKVTFGGRFHNRAPKSHVELLYSLDEQKSWTRAWILSSTKQPWDVIHYANVAIPAGHRSVWLKYAMTTTEASPQGCSIFALRMEADYKPEQSPVFRPFAVTFNWSERQTDHTLVERSHTQTITKLPAKYVIDVGGADQPVVNSLAVALTPQPPLPRTGEGEQRNLPSPVLGGGAGGGGSAKYVGRWVEYGPNLAAGKTYTLSVPSSTEWSAGDTDGKKLTDGVVGPPVSGGITMSYGAIWKPNTNPVVTLDLGAPSTCAGFGMNVNGYEWWDALKGEVTDRIEVLTSLDGKEYASRGFLQTDIRWKDLPVNHMWPDDELLTAHTFRLVPEKPVSARYVQYRVKSSRFFDCTELEVLDSIKYDPFDLRIALPDEWSAADPVPPAREERDPANESVATANADETTHVRRGESPSRPSLRSESAGRLAARKVGGDGDSALRPGADGASGAKPVGEPVLEPATMHSLGVHWIVQGDEEKKARIELSYRKAGAGSWAEGLPLLRVEKGGNKLERGESLVKAPPDAWLFAGSALLLEPDTAYELRLRLVGAESAPVERVLKSRTAAEPIAPASAPTFHVAPGTGGGIGTSASPYRGLAEARAHAKPGDILLLHAGIYAGEFAPDKSGEPGRAILWRGAGDGEAIIDGGGTQKAAVDAYGLHDVWFERLTIRNAEWGLAANNGVRIVVRRCRFYNVHNGFTATRNTGACQTGIFVADNVFDGPFTTWPPEKRGASVIEYRGIQISGTGCEVCYNRVHGFKDGIDTFPSAACCDIDIHHNEISECLDDGCELDGSERNVRLFENRFTNVFQGISVQPIYGGPAYAFQNAVYNIDVEPIKMHNSPSGALFFHNTFVKHGPPLLLMTSERVRNCILRDNLFVGTEGNYAYECMPPMEGCDFDYDGFAGGPWRMFLKWNGGRYATLDEVRAKAPVYKHAAQLAAAGLFSSGARPPAAWEQRAAAQDLRLAEGTAAATAGITLPGFSSRALGAYPAGAPLPHYGPRSER